MATKRSKDTIAAMLSSAPPLAPVDGEDQAGGGNRPVTGEVVTVTGSDLPVTGSHVPVAPSADEVMYEAIAEPLRPSHLRPAEHIHPSQMPPVREDELDDEDLEAFAFDTDAPLVRPRRREQKDYQTVRINRPTAKILRAQWLLARQVDPLMSYTEFSTIVTQRGLRALAEERRRDGGDQLS